MEVMLSLSASTFTELSTPALAWCSSAQQRGLSWSFLHLQPPTGGGFWKRASVVVRAKKPRDPKPDTHSHVARPDESTGPFPEAVLLKKKVVQEDSSLQSDFADAEDEKLLDFLGLQLESDLNVQQMRHYEVVYLIHEDNVNDVETIVAKVQDFVRERKGRIYRLNNWGLRRLAYKIKKATMANYILMNFELETGSINDFKTMLDKDERIIRHLVIKRDRAFTEDFPPPPEYHKLRASQMAGDDEYYVDDEDDDYDLDDDEYDVDVGDDGDDDGSYEEDEYSIDEEEEDGEYGYEDDEESDIEDGDEEYDYEDEESDIDNGEEDAGNYNPDSSADEGMDEKLKLKRGSYDVDHNAGGSSVGKILVADRERDSSIKGTRTFMAKRKR